MRNHGAQTRPERRMDKKGPYHENTDVGQQMGPHSQCSKWALAIGPFDHSVYSTFLDHGHWDPETGTEAHKTIGKDDVRQVGLVLVNIGSLESSVNAQERDKMVQIGVMIKGIGVAVMGVRMLVLPHDGIAQKGHGPHSPVVDPRLSARGVVASIVAESSYQPAEYGQGETSEDTSLE